MQELCDTLDITQFELFRLFEQIIKKILENLYLFYLCALSF